MTPTAQETISHLITARYDASCIETMLSRYPDRECVPTVLEKVNKARGYLRDALAVIYAEEYTLQVLEKDTQRLIEEAAQ